MTFILALYATFLYRNIDRWCLHFIANLIPKEGAAQNVLSYDSCLVKITEIAKQKQSDRNLGSSMHKTSEKGCHV